jgi:hypothetical protein
MRSPASPERVLDEIRRLDALEWGMPCNGRAVEIDKLERQYLAMTGFPCPAWPRRGR